MTTGSLTARTAIGIYLVVLSVYLLTAAGHFFSTDHVAVYLTTEALVERGDLAIRPINDAVPGRDGRHYAAFGLGQSLAIVPLYILGRIVDRTGSASLQEYFGGMQLGDWGGTVPIFFVSLFNQLLTPLTCVVLFLFLRRMQCPIRHALATTLIFGLSTGTWVYARDSFQHPLETLALLTSIYIVFANRDHLERRHLALAGTALAMAVLTRINVLLIVPVCVAYVGWTVLVGRRARGHAHTLEGARDLTLACAVFVAPVVIGLLAIMTLNHFRFGQFLSFHVPGQARGLSTPLWAGLYGNLFSAGRSLWLYSPPLILSLFTFGAFYRRYRAEALLFGGIVLTYLTLYSSYGFWDGGWAYGPRFLLALVPFLMLPVGMSIGVPRVARALTPLVILGFGVQILGVTINYDFVYWDWIRMNLSPPDAYLFVPHLSAIPTHFGHLMNGRYVDLWILEVYERFGAGAFMLTLGFPAGIFAAGIGLLRPAWSLGRRTHTHPPKPAIPATRSMALSGPGA